MNSEIIENTYKSERGVMVQPSIPTESCAEEAKNEHAAIVEDWKHLADNWVSFTRRVEAFKQKKFFRHIKDQQTGKVFTRFAKWAEAALGQSASAVFSHLQILKELTGIVPDEKLASM